MSNSNKVVSANKDRIIVSYLDTQKIKIVQYDRTLVNDFQLYGKTYRTKQNQFYESDRLTNKQQFLYREVLYGLDAYEPHVVANMRSEHKIHIIQTQQKAQRLINKWKNELMQTVIKKCEKIFYKSQFMKDLCNFESVDDYETNSLSFRDLGINKSMIIDKLIEENLLPENYYKLR